MSDWWELPGTGTFGETGEESLSGSGEPAAGESADVLGDHLWVFDDGAVWDLGPAQVDADSDGVPDSLTRDADGLVTVYTDAGADGRVNRIAELDESGNCAVRSLNAGTGQWQPTALGRVD